MKLVKLVGITDSEVEDILNYTGILIYKDGDVVLLEDWTDIEDIFSDVEVKKFEI